ncbi:MAG: class I SAM-dependent methyltransferase [Hyphomonadaceae bacterium]
MSDPQDQALRTLLQALHQLSYQFVTPTPATHSRVLARLSAAPGGADLRAILGWSQPFHWDDDPYGHIVKLLQTAGALERAESGEMRSLVRVSTLEEQLYLHSAFPTAQSDAVFFGPDSYRYAAFLRAELPQLHPRQRLVDVGAGSGVGGIVAASLLPGARITLADINDKALRFARINSAFNGVMAEFVRTDGLKDVKGAIDCVIANPPYIVDPAHRAYRDGGGMHGGELSLRWAREAAQRLDRGGAFLLYTGSAIVDGEDLLKTALLKALEQFDVTYREIDPDVFGEELERDDYADVDRIAVVGLVAVKR